MVTSRNTRADVVAAAGRLFAEKGYHGTSMRDLGKELGLLGSSLYAHVDSKEDLLVDVVAKGAELFQALADAALDVEGTARDRLEALIGGHVDVVLDNLDVARTFLNEARMLNRGHRGKVIQVRDSYEQSFRQVLLEGKQDGSFHPDVDPKTASIFILSILNAIERWYRPGGSLSRDLLVERLSEFALTGLS